MDVSHYSSSGVHTQAVESLEDLWHKAYTSGSFSDMQQIWSATEKKQLLQSLHPS